MVLLTRSADLRQARHTSIIENIVLWTDRDGANPALDLRNLLNDLGPARRAHRRRIRHPRPDRLQRPPARRAVADLRPDRRRVRHRQPPAPVQEPGRDQEGREGRALADDALDAALPLIKQGGDEAAILAAMQGAIFAGGGDYPANEFIIGSGAGRAALPLQGRPPQAQQERPADPRMGRRLPPLPRGDDAHGADRQAVEAASGTVRRRARSASRRRKGDDARQHVRRRLRRPCASRWRRTA